jgi:hypothetical protein
MNDEDFKRHLKDLAHGHHHPEEHDWGGKVAKKAGAPVRSAASKRHPAGKKIRPPGAKRKAS